MTLFRVKLGAVHVAVLDDGGKLVPVRGRRNDIVLITATETIGMGEVLISP